MRYRVKYTNKCHGGRGGELVQTIKAMSGDLYFLEDDNGEIFIIHEKDIAREHCPVAPDGWELTGEFRCVNRDEHYLRNGEAALWGCSGPSIDWYHILKRSKPNDIPDGWEWTGEFRRAKEGEYYLYYGKALGPASCCYIREYYILRPIQPAPPDMSKFPNYILGEYRLPKTGEYYYDPQQIPKFQIMKATVDHMEKKGYIMVPKKYTLATVPPDTYFTINGMRAYKGTNGYIRLNNWNDFDKEVEIED